MSYDITRDNIYTISSHFTGFHKFCYMVQLISRHTQKRIWTNCECYEGTLIRRKTIHFDFLNYKLNLFPFFPIYIVVTNTERGFKCHRNLIAIDRFTISVLPTGCASCAGGCGIERGQTNQATRLPPHHVCISGTLRDYIHTWWHQTVLI